MPVANMSIPNVGDNWFACAAIKEREFSVLSHMRIEHIKKAVEEVFGVEVEKVTTMNYIGKPKRQGVFQGKRADWKKAVVKLKEGSKTIELFEG